ncbi:MAG: FAD dependent oxidoreductase [Candidatus Nanosalina sp. J07AB43]|nr:MAG: FAD dependent oxidoreductase [Candidatus Nanosalina sp. J07AB43]
MEDEYDVVVVGAGPAGSQAAKTIGSRGYDVAVLEAENADDYPAQSNKSTAGSFPRMMGEFNIPDEVVMKNTGKVVLEGPDEHYTQDRVGSVLEYADFKQYLVDEAEERGVDFSFGSRVNAPYIEDGDVSGVKYSGDEIVRSDIVIDGSGPSAPIAQDEEVGFIELERDRQAVGWEYLLEDADLDAEGHADLNDSMMLRLDHDIAPGGYSWIFDAGDGTAKAGLCYIDTDAHREYGGEDFNIIDSLEEWIAEDERFPEVEARDDIDPLEKHQGSAHIQIPDQVSADSVMGVGDTVSSIDPLWGEGIDTAMKSGKYAGITALEALGREETDTSAQMMKKYDRLWRNNVAENRWERNFMTYLMYNMDNDRYNRLIQDLDSLSDNDDQDALRKINQGNFTESLKLLELGDIPNMLKVGKDRIGKHPALR